MRTNLLVIAGLLFTVALFAGCASAPSADVDAARAALAAADSAEADVYVAELYTAATDSLAAAETEIQNQAAQSAFSRDYTHVSELLAFVTITAGQAIEQAPGRKETVRIEAESLIAQAQEATAEAHALLAAAPRGATTAVSALEETRSLETTLADAVQAQEQGSFAEAHDLARAALEKAQALITSLSGNTSGQKL